MNVTPSPEFVEKMDRQKKIADLQAAVDEGEADIAAGRFTRITSDKELDEFFASL